jgi:hypothetical protein
VKKVEFALKQGLDGGGWLTPRPSRFTLRKETRYPLYRRLGGPQGPSGRVRKIWPPPGFFLFSVLHLHCFFVLTVPFVFTVQHTKQISKPPGGIRTRNPSKRLAADPRLIPLGHWNRLRSLDRPARNKFLYRLSHPGSLYISTSKNTGIVPQRNQLYVNTSWKCIASK